jgi:hypothetical protein
MNARRIQAGTYRGHAIEGTEQYGTTSNGNDQIVIDLMLTDISEKVSAFLVFSDKSAPYSMERLRALGWQGNDLSNLTGIHRNVVDVEVKYEMYQGKENMKVEIRTGGVALKDKLDDKGKRAFAARYAHLAKATATVASAPAPATRNNAPAANEASAATDDLPF